MIITKSIFLKFYLIWLIVLVCSVSSKSQSMYHFSINLSNENIPSNLSINRVFITGNFAGEKNLDLAINTSRTFRKSIPVLDIPCFEGRQIIFKYNYELKNSSTNNIEYIYSELVEICSEFEIYNNNTVNKVIYSGRRILPTMNEPTQIFCFNKCEPCTTITPIYSPNPFISASDFFGVERYLNRAIDMPEMVLQSFIIDAFGSRYTNPGIKTGIVTNFNCTNPCSQICDSKYCPINYRQDIQLLTDLKASMILGTVGYVSEDNWIVSDIDHIWSHNGVFFNERRVKDRIYAISKMIKDINTAYDQNSLRRPIIDAFIPETLNPTISNWAPLNNSKMVEYIKIPISVINYFKSEIIELNANSLYLNNDLSARDNIRFNYNRITSRDGIESIYPHLSNLEARMYLFFVAKQFIDMGFTGIQLSQINLWSKSQQNFPDDHRGIAGGQSTVSVTDTQITKETHPSSDMSTQEWKKFAYYLGNLCDKIREYARSNNKFVLLSTQADRIFYKHDKVNNSYVKRLDSNGKPFYILDFNVTAMRPREVVNNSNPLGRNLKSGNLCSMSLSSMNVSDFNIITNNFCNCLKATIDPCSGILYERNGEGYTPRPWANELPNALPNGRYMTKQPQLVGIDGGGGVDIIPNPVPNNICSFPVTYSQNGVNNNHVFGLDDSRWFSEFAAINGENCINRWLEFQYSNVKKFDFINTNIQLPNSFVHMTGRVMHRRVKDVDLLNPANLSSIGGVPHSFYRLAENVNTHNYIKNNIWNVNEINTTSILVQDINQTTKKFSVSQPDKSSIYTWHILYSNGTYAPFTVGTERLFTNTTGMCYSITLRQDNLGLNPSLFGTKTASLYNLCNSLVDENVPENRSPSSIVIFPNPTNDYITVETPESLFNTKFICKINNVFGITIDVFLINQNITQLDISKYPAGVYYFSIYENSNLNIHKSTKIFKL